MRWNLLYPLWVWLLGSILMSMICTRWPAIYTYDIGSGWSFAYLAGFFFGILTCVLQSSVIVFIFLNVLYYVLAARIYLPQLQVKIALILLFLVGSFIANSVYYDLTWFRPFFMIYAGIHIILFWLLYVDQYDAEYYNQ